MFIGEIQEVGVIEPLSAPESEPVETEPPSSPDEAPSAVPVEDPVPI